ncbi:Homeodomain-like protein, partial [Lentinula raphanica]
RTVKPKELETLTEAVTAEFRRLKAFEGQGRNLDAIDLAADASNLNWRTIAEKVSDVSTFARSDHECRTKWLGYYRPGICHDEWSSDELRRLNEIVSEKNEEHALDWVDVAQELGTNRTPMDCMRHGFKLPQHAWDSDADKRLSEAVEVYGTENWPLVALHVSPNVTSNQCLMRYHRSLDPSLNKSPWSDDEDERLNVIVSVLGTTNWPDVARHMPGRTNEMCRERYVEGMRNKGKLKAKGKARAKSEWTKDKDEELVRLVGDLGNKWQKISTILGGVHTHNQVRFVVPFCEM